MASKKKAAPVGTRRGVDVRSRCNHSTHKRRGESAHNQRLRLLAYLTRHGAVTTIEARAALAIMSPAARIWELRNRAGVDIITERDRRGIATYRLLAVAGGDHAG